MLTRDTHGPGPGPGPSGLRTAGAAAIMEPPDGTAQLELTRRTGNDGQVVIALSGELDIVTAEKAYTYVCDVIDQGARPVDMDLAGLTFCDARGLAVMARMARHAEHAGCQLRLTATLPRVLKIMRITGFDRQRPGLTIIGPAETAPARSRLSVVSS